MLISRLPALIASFYERLNIAAVFSRPLAVMTVRNVLLKAGNATDPCEKCTQNTQTALLNKGHNAFAFDAKCFWFG